MLQIRVCWDEGKGEIFFSTHSWNLHRARCFWIACSSRVRIRGVTRRRPMAQWSTGLHWTPQLDSTPKLTGRFNQLHTQSNEWDDWMGPKFCRGGTIQIYQPQDEPNCGLHNEVCTVILSKRCTLDHNYLYNTYQTITHRCIKILKFFIIIILKMMSSC